MGDVEQSAGMVMPGGRAEKWGQGRPPGGWRYRHHFRNKTKKNALRLRLLCLGSGELRSRFRPITAWPCREGRPGGHSWRAPLAVPTRAKPSGASHEASQGRLRPLHLNAGPCRGRTEAWTHGGEACLIVRAVLGLTGVPGCWGRNRSWLP